MSTLWPARKPDLDLDTLGHLTVAVRQNRRSRWAWHLVDSRDGSSFESQYEFDSAIAARRSGLARLAELTPSLPPAAAPQRHRHLVIVSDDAAVYGLVHQVFAENKGIEIIRDRRRPSPSPDRRNGDRRSMNVDAVVQARGWCIVCRSGACDTTRALDESA
jgi:hypothetical protein